MVVAVSSTADAPRSVPALSVVAGAPSAGPRAPRPWAAPLPRPAARILLAGGLTLAGWLLGAALSNATASADELPACTQSDTVAAKPAQAAKPHHRKHRDVAAQDTCAKPPAEGEKTQADEKPTADETQPAATDEVTTDSAPPPSAKKQNTTKLTSDGLLGGLIGGIVDVVSGTLNAVTSTVGTLGHAVADPLTKPPVDNPAAPPILPIGGILDPVLDGVSGSGSVTVTVPTSAVDVVTTATADVTAVVPDAAAPVQATTRATVATPHITLIPLQRQLPAKADQPRDSGVHARNGGGDNGPGLPSAPSAPSAPASSVSSGHDGPGGARQPFAVHADAITTTQLKLAGTNRDHAADHAGREAALPTTSPD